MAGMGGHAVQVIGPGGQMLPPGTYQLEVPREAGSKQQQQQQQQQLRFAYPGRGSGRSGARGPGPAAFAGRGPPGSMIMGGRGMQQVSPVRTRVGRYSFGLSSDRIRGMGCSSHAMQ